MQTLLLKIIDDKAYLSDKKSLTLLQVGFPEWIEKFYRNACWLIRVTKYNQQEKKVHAEIEEYDHPETSFSPSQVSFITENLIEQISFRTLDTVQLLSYAKPVAVYTIPAVEQPSLAGENDQPAITLNYHYSIPIKKFRFGFGQVATDIYIEPLRKEVEIQIPNIEIRPEFDAIKNYFSNTLKTKKFDVDIEITMQGNEITGKKAFSLQVEKINKAMIETVRFEFVEKSFLKNRIEIDQNMLTAEEMFEHFSETKSSAFYDNENQLFEDLLNIKNAKHYTHLRYLSSIHAHDILKLRFIIKPFSFIFLIKGQSKFHIVWETLDSEEATYIWHTDKNIPGLKQKLKEIDLILNTIKVQGKTVYLNERPGDFSSVIHDYRSLTDGFIKWKSEVDQRLV